jgi:hypothetical protein
MLALSDGWRTRLGVRFDVYDPTLLVTRAKKQSCFTFRDPHNRARLRTPARFLSMYRFSQQVSMTDRITLYRISESLYY